MKKSTSKANEKEDVSLFFFLIIIVMFITTMIVYQDVKEHPEYMIENSETAITEVSDIATA